MTQQWTRILSVFGGIETPITELRANQDQEADKHMGDHYYQMPLSTHGTPKTDVGVKNGLRPSDLIEPASLKRVFQDIHNHLAANARGMTRSGALAQQLINLLFFKLYDELQTSPGDLLEFCQRQGESPKSLRARLLPHFDRQIKPAYPEIFGPEDAIELDADSLTHIVRHLQQYRIAGAGRDAIGDAFETIVGYTLKGSRGQFFTPRNVVKMMVDITDPEPEERILDPACGSGGFLVMAFRHIQDKVNNSSVSKVLGGALVGIDKDEFLAKVTRAYLTILGAEDAYVFSENSLAPPTQWSTEAQQHIEFGSFDLVLTNPPFGKKLTIKDAQTLAQFDLGHKWRRSHSSGKFVKTDRTVYTPAQILFIERCLDFLRDGGRLGIVLPESIFGNPSYEYIMQHLQERGRFLAVISMPEELFQPFTHTKTCIAIIQKKKQAGNYTFFMGIANWCGHDSRGNPTIRRDPNTGKEELLDDVPKIATRYAALMRGEGQDSQDHLGFRIQHSEIRNNIFVSKYYDPDIAQRLEALRTTHDLITVQSLVDQGILSVQTGVEVGRLAYGTGPIPFIRTSDIANWELKSDPKHSVSEEIYQRYKDKAEVRPGDILLVRDGTYLVGTSCIISEYDTKILFQSHIYRLRVHQPDKLDPFLLFAALNSPIVKRQIRAKRFTQDIIDTLGSRIYELLLPFPKDEEIRKNIADRTREIIRTRARLRQAAREVVVAVGGGIEEFDPGTGVL